MPTDAKMKEQQLRQERSELEFYMEKEDFSSIIGSRTPDEKEVLIVLLKENAALTIGTIRNCIVRSYADRYKEQLLKLTNTELYLIDPNYTGSVSKKSEKEWKHIGMEKWISAAIESIKKYEKTDQDKANILKTFIDDAALIQHNINPLPMYVKVAVWDKALQKIGSSAPSRKAVITSVRYLDGIELDRNNQPVFEGLGLLSKRKLEGTKGDWAFYVATRIRNLWDVKCQQMQERVMKGYKPTNSDKELYL